MRKITNLILLYLLSIHYLMAQQIMVTGTVLNGEDKEPIIGAAVVIKGTAIGTVTDYDGQFNLNAEKGVTLLVSYVGMKSIEVKAQETMRIILESNLQELDDVIVVAYGSGKKSTFTGSATTVKSEAIERIKTSNLTQTLQEQSSGVQVINNSGQPGDDASIMIRGIGSINASSSPLYVVDGVAYAGYYNAINPGDVESITILKDASATALYGSRAANGVIMITTKKRTIRKGSYQLQIHFWFLETGC
ncbi:MAG: TonB-dependent receptor plug domain-containing protein [Tannerellaceae bacterium]|nr:TonB-dependent receptor plug domain-containing protein [Tannerellaceae bacterium]